MKAEQVDQMSLQEALDYSVQKIVEQGQQCSINALQCFLSTLDQELPSMEVCTYGDYHGNHCAIGWLLDEEDDELMTYGSSVTDMIYDLGSKLPELITGNSRDLFEMFQFFHDDPSKNIRQSIMETLNVTHNIDTSGKHWRRWVDMGA